MNSRSALLALAMVTVATMCGVGLVSVETPAVALTRSALARASTSVTSPFATSIEESKRLVPEGGADTVYLTSGPSFADAVASLPFTRVAGAPILMVATDHIPDDVARELVRLHPARIVLIGDHLRVSATMETTLGAFAPSIERVIGPEGFGLARAVAQSQLGTSVPALFIATRVNFPESLLPGLPDALSGLPVVLVDGATASIDAQTKEFLMALKPGSVTIIGGEAAVSRGIELGVRSIVPTVFRLEGTGVNRIDTGLTPDQLLASVLPYFSTGIHSPQALASAINAIAAGAPLMLVPGNCIPIEVIERLGATAVGPTYPQGAATPPTPPVGPSTTCPPMPSPFPTPATPPAQTEKPGPTNTGVPYGLPLRVHQGDLIVREAGTVITGLDIRGLVFVQAPDVTIKNSIIRGRVTPGNAALLSNSSAGLLVEDVEMYSADPSWKIKGFVGSNATFRRVNIHTVTDQVHITGDNVTVVNSWLHANLHYANDPNNGGPTHDDNIQIQGGVNMRFVGNVMEGSHNAAVQITQDTGVVGSVVLASNWLNTGSCTVNVLDKSRGPIRSMSILDNTFGRDTRYRNCGIITTPTTKPFLDVQRNFYANDSAPVNVNLF